MKKHKTDKKSRTHTIEFDFGEAVTSDSIMINLNDGTAQLALNGKALTPKSSTIKKSYHREKGPKVTFKATSQSEKPSIIPELTLSTYDAIYAIDTNTKKINDETISITGVIRGILYPRKNETAVRFSPIFCIEHRDIKSDHENIGWAEAIKLIIKEPRLHTHEKSYAIIVDSNLGLLDSYNKREIPLTKDFYLPLGFTLIYASSDTKNDGIGNLMIAQADKEASTILSALVKSNNKDFGRIFGMPFTAQRIWTLNNEPGPASVARME